MGGLPPVSYTHLDVYKRQDRGRATIVGTQTFGKGVVQYVLPVGTRGAGMQLTVAQRCV